MVFNTIVKRRVKSAWRWSSADKDILVNLIARIATAIFSIAVIPFYIKKIGIEGWGAIGFQTTLQVVFSFAEIGIPAMVLREISKNLGRHNCINAATLVSVSERVLLVIAAGITCVLYVYSPFLANDWLRPMHISSEHLIMSLRLAGLQIGINLVTLVYSATLIGLGDQLILNKIVVFGAIFRAALTIFVLFFVEPTVPMFFLSQTTISAIVLVLMSRTVRRSIGYSRVCWEDFKDVVASQWRFAGAMTLSNALQAAAAQIDRLVLSNVASLTSLGYYALAGSITAPVLLLSNSVSQAYYPALCRSVESETQVRLQYLNMCKRTGWVTWPAVVVIAFFGRELVFIWTGDQNTASSLELPLVFLALHAGISTVNQMGNSLQTARAKPRLMLFGTALSSFVALVLLVSFAKSYGISGVSASVLASSIFYYFFSVQQTHRAVFQLDHWQPTLVGVVRPACTSVVFCSLICLFIRICK